MVCTHRVDRARPPGHHEAKEAGHDHAGQGTDAELDGQPTRAGDALSPRQAEGAGLELVRDERRPPEHPDEGRDRKEEESQRHLYRSVGVGERGGGSRAVVVRTRR